jgi:hypothetical protein
MHRSALPSAEVLDLGLGRSSVGLTRSIELGGCQAVKGGTGRGVSLAEEGSITGCHLVCLVHPAALRFQIFDKIGSDL